MCAMIRMVWEDDCSWNEVATSETTNNASGMRFRPVSVEGASQSLFGEPEPLLRT